MAGCHDPNFYLEIEQGACWDMDLCLPNRQAFCSAACSVRITGMPCASLDLRRFCAGQEVITPPLLRKRGG